MTSASNAASLSKRQSERQTPANAAESFEEEGAVESDILIGEDGESLLLPRGFKLEVDGQEVIEIGDYIYSVDAQKIIYYRGTKTKLNIPAALKKDGVEYPVKAIGDSAFLGTNLQNKLKKLTLPESIAKIGPYAFYKNNIAALSSDTQNSQLKEIGKEAFRENSLKKAELSDKLATVAGDAFLNNPGLEEDPDHRVSLILRDGEGKAANPHQLADGVKHMINKSLLIIRRVLSGTDAEIALPERKLLPIGEPYTFTPKASTLYLPISGEPVAVEKTEETQEIKLPYIKNEQFNPDAINIDLAHARNGKKDTNQPYKLKDYNRDTMMPLVLSVSESGDIIHIPDAWVYVDLNTPELGDWIEKVTWPSNIADLASSTNLRRE